MKLRLYSWNVNGLRAVLRKNALQEFLEQEKPDVLCLQEIKCNPSQLDLIELNALKGYKIFWNPAERRGYSGTAILIKTDIPCKEKPFRTDDTEGRVLTLEFDKFFLVNVYTPNSKPDLSRLSLREKKWDPEFKNYLKELEKSGKPVISCGDFNAAHEEIDLARPKENHHNAGFTDEERQGITNLLGAGFLDTFRYQHPEEEKYTWWSFRQKAREKNVGWRIDYFFVSQSLGKNLVSAKIYNNYLGSDHCPISIELEI